MLKLNSRHRIYIVVTFYRRYFVSFALPEALAPPSSSLLAAAARLSPDRAPRTPLPGEARSAFG